MDRRILFAEFMGWERAENGIAVWNRPGTTGLTQYAEHELPDCENNDTDCMALCDALVEIGYEFMIFKSAASPHVTLWKVEDRDIQAGPPIGSEFGNKFGDSWRDGVCDLAEPIIREAMDETAGTAD